MEERRTKLEGLARGLPDPVRLLEQSGQRLDDWSERFANAAGAFVARRAQELRLVGDLKKALDRLVQAKGQSLAVTLARLRKEPLIADIARHRRDVDRLSVRMRPAAARLLDRIAVRLDGLDRRLENLSYRRVLARGYALVRDAAGNAVTLAVATTAGMAVSIEFQDGAVGATIGDESPRRSPG